MKRTCTLSLVAALIAGPVQNTWTRINFKNGDHKDIFVNYCEVRSLNWLQCYQLDPTGREEQETEGFQQNQVKSIEDTPESEYTRRMRDRLAQEAMLRQ